MTVFVRVRGGPDLASFGRELPDDRVAYLATARPGSRIDVCSQRFKPRRSAP